MVTVGQVKESLNIYDEGREIVFAAVHKEDLKILDRCCENNVGSVTNHPMMILKPYAFGESGLSSKHNAIVTVFLTE